MTHLYRNKMIYKAIVIVIAFLIAAFSIYYTNQLVKELQNSELRQIDLFAKAQKAIVSPDSHDGLSFLLTEIIETNRTIPVILTDELGTPIAYRNIQVPSHLSKEEKDAFLRKELTSMHDKPAIEVNLGDGWKQYIHYTDSLVLKKLRYYPYIQLSVITIFGILTYLIFSSVRRAEQNRIWVGLAKETAHQLGTPISSLMAWVEVLKSEETLDKSIIEEITKDIQRLQTITSRFSSIGSEPMLSVCNLIEITEKAIEYLRSRISQKVSISLEKPSQPIMVALNASLYEWVIENLCKNAVDAMNGIGKIQISICPNFSRSIAEICVTDTGKGIPSSKFKTIFKAGYTTKKRGWGLGLTLAKRIIEEYHRGKIYVKQSELNAGTTFCIELPLDIHDN
ncbi:MAG: HAMP domain-containing histidine kinase [Cytophagales bacterium]|nr:HAMP domain-containing histidine kinase [Cytophagales bacterium]MDW8384645.1 HAMP domain-containing sensor histidine kinase [Flammeovirgaceae bacterium]